MRLFLVVRHGQSLLNVEGIVNADARLDHGLSDQGIEEAERARRSTSTARRRRTRTGSASPAGRASTRPPSAKRAFERLLGRGEQVTLAVCHEVPARYLANGAAGSAELNGPLANGARYAFDDASLRRAVERIRELAG